jgi:hypothetical protein
MPVYNHKNIADNDEHYTQSWVFERLGLKFDLDVCAPEGGVSWIPAKSHYSLIDDALTQEWHGNVWMNPPYSKPAPWVDKFIAHGQGIALLPVTRGMWFDKIWFAADALVIDRYNNKFTRPDGTQKSITFRTVFVALGQENVQALDRLGLGRVR